MIKASDTRDDADALALKYLLMDRDAAQAAGIYTGYYHYTILPNTTNKESVILDAKAQAQKALWRLSSLGGYTEKDLPYALDLEYNCVQVSNGSCVKYAPKPLVTLWAETWLETMYEKLAVSHFFILIQHFLSKRWLEVRNYANIHYGKRNTESILQIRLLSQGEKNLAALFTLGQLLTAHRSGKFGSIHRAELARSMEWHHQGLI